MLGKERFMQAARTALGIMAIVGVSNTFDRGETDIVLAGGGPRVEIFYPKEGTTLDSLRIGLSWTPFFLSNTKVTQMNFLLIPNNNIGLGIAAYAGAMDEFSDNVFGIKAPRIDQSPSGESAEDCIILPDKSYKWKVRASDAPYPVDPHGNDNWGPFSETNFRTAKRTAEAITAIEPTDQPGSMPIVDTYTPTLRWRNSNLGKGVSDVFYYEIQLSKDQNFESDPNKAWAPLYYEFINGCETDPINAYKVREKYKLDANSEYYWRVRPRVQLDGKEVPWSETFRFKTAASN